MAKNSKAVEGTFSRKPFISHDGMDAQGVRSEVKVVVGYGTVNGIEPTESGKSNKVNFLVGNTTYNPSGYTRDEAIIKKLEAAQEANEPINFRIETRRKNDVDRSKPYEELKTDKGAEVVKSLAAVRLEDDTEWTLSKDAVTRLDEDPVSGGLVNANSQSKEELRGSSRSSTTTSSRSGAFEPAPYVAKWRGEINPGCIAVNVPITFYVEIFNYEKEKGFELTSERRKEIAEVLLKIANRLQKDIYVRKLNSEYEGLDLTAGSHTRARALIFEAMRSFSPLT